MGWVRWLTVTCCKPCPVRLLIPLTYRRTIFLLFVALCMGHALPVNIGSSHQPATGCGGIGNPYMGATSPHSLTPKMALEVPPCSREPLLLTYELIDSGWKSLDGQSPWISLGTAPSREQNCSCCWLPQNPEVNPVASSDGCGPMTASAFQTRHRTEYRGHWEDTRHLSSHSCGASLGEPPQLPPVTFVTAVTAN